MKKLLFLFSFLVVLLPSLSYAAMMETSAKQAVILDMGTGMVLLNKNANQKMPTSSMSKVMTAYMVFDALEQGRVQMDTEFLVSEKAWKKGGSKMFIEAGDNVTVENLLKGLIVQSGNDAAIALAEGLMGSEDAFAKVMTQKAQSLGMKNTNLTNASGWPDPDHYSTANDLAILAQRLIVDFPHKYSLYSMKEFEYGGIKQPNRNPLLYRDLGVDGIKTGHTEAGGYGLMASGERNGRRVVMVVNGLKDVEARANESARLMGWALSNFENMTLVTSGQELETAQTIFAEIDALPLTVNRDIRISVPVGQKDQIVLKAEYDEPIQAPLKQGDKVGLLHISVPQIGDFAVPLVAAQDLNKAGLFGGMIDKLQMMMSGE